MPVIGLHTAVEGLLLLAEADGAALGADRAVNLPGLSVTVSEMVDSVRRVAAGRPLGEITVAPDPDVGAIVDTWARRSSSERALALGLPRDESLDDIVQAYIEDHVT